ncbi:hypothetical protein DL766_003689 [Monosporascus sp. MC13-8B]|uniref:Uncharacterized protein n=1 Tax=Monosporascus cannonballus TaxID=155416 RepID=A0ABY0GYM4_9PEZI|nr:hypothetical protein DL762_007595 [Monosporascus cannonballus]RYO82128.1 hypothetical protein DL763_008324 [Monosporascus cannonballus]RYP32965.1 hypothetical protein DL766_003689 [Monosporascus sp. MC13-8B]
MVEHYITARLLRQKGYHRRADGAEYADHRERIGAAGYHVLDTSSVSDTQPFVKRIAFKHPELEYLVNKVGLQRQLQVQKQSAEDLPPKADQKIDINIRGPLHLASTNLRGQLKDTQVRPVDIAPPPAETDLHREREEPDDNKKAKNPNALSIPEFMDEASRD